METLNNLNDKYKNFLEIAKKGNLLPANSFFESIEAGSYEEALRMHMDILIKHFKEVQENFNPSAHSKAFQDRISHFVFALTYLNELYSIENKNPDERNVGDVFESVTPWDDKDYDAFWDVFSVYTKEKIVDLIKKIDEEFENDLKEPANQANEVSEFPAGKEEEKKIKNNQIDDNDLEKAEEEIETLKNKMQKAIDGGMLGLTVSFNGSLDGTEKSGQKQLFYDPKNKIFVKMNYQFYYKYPNLDCVNLLAPLRNYEDGDWKLFTQHWFVLREEDRETKEADLQYRLILRIPIQSESEGESKSSYLDYRKGTHISFALQLPLSVQLDNDLNKLLSSVDSKLVKVFEKVLDGYVDKHMKDYWKEIQRLCLLQIGKLSEKHKELKGDFKLSELPSA